MTVPGTRIDKIWKKQGWRGGTGAEVGSLIASYWATNTGCENPAVTRDGASPAADRFLISEPAAFHVEFPAWFRYEDITTGQFWELSHPSTLHYPTFKKKKKKATTGFMIKYLHSV